MTRPTDLDAFLARRLGGAPLRLPLVDHPPGLRIGLGEFLLAPDEEVTCDALDRVAALADEVFGRCFSATDDAWAVAQYGGAVRLRLPPGVTPLDGHLDPDEVDVELDRGEVPLDQWLLLQRLLGLPGLPLESVRTGVGLYGSTARQGADLGVEVEDEPVPFVEVRVPLPPGLDPQELFRHVARRDFPPCGPSLSWDVHLVNLSRELVLTVYDDRGLVVIGRPADLRAIRATYGDLVMEAPGLD